MTARGGLARVGLALSALVLLALGLAYPLTGRAAHELLGTAMLALLVVHVALNRRWWRGLHRTPLRARLLLRALANLGMAAAILGLAVISVTVSRLVFAPLGLEGGVIARDWHIALGWWALVALGLHLGANAARLAGLVPRPRAPGRGLRFGLWALALGLAFWGVEAAARLDLIDKLRMRFGFRMWDFEADAAGFFLSVAGVPALIAVPVALLPRPPAVRPRHPAPGAEPRASSRPFLFRKEPLR
ncbi:MAG: DUF4405 domain-containing protein [Pseudomonadota bacterium]|nr:DUF4405 domain-containing protein [Pseudomonadota bacterium]MEE3100777.1 DUF4405 domain-containing protein [Pseudomonadota bacterium]